MYDNEDDDLGCLQGAILGIGLTLTFVGLGWAFFGIIEHAGKYIVTLFWIIVAAVVIMKLFNLDKK